MARQKHPGQKNNLDALCKRYAVLITVTSDSCTAHYWMPEILADVYLAMTGGQISLLGESEDLTHTQGSRAGDASRSTAPASDGAADRQGGKQQPGQPTPVVKASKTELAMHAKWIELLERESPGKVIWQQIESVD